MVPRPRLAATCTACQGSWCSADSHTSSARLPLVATTVSISAGQSTDAPKNRISPRSRIRSSTAKCGAASPSSICTGGLCSRTMSSRSVFSRRRLCSIDQEMRRSSKSMPSGERPNLVQITTSFQRPASARPRNVSLRPSA